MVFVTECLTSLTNAEEKGKETARKVAAIDKTPSLLPTVPDGSIILRNVSGQEINAKLLSAYGDSIRLMRSEDGAEFVVEMSMFDDFTKERIQNWIKSDPTAVSYSVAISSEKVMTDSNTFLSQGRELETAKWTYRVTVTNLTRNPLADAEVEYRIVYDDEVEFSRTTAGPGKGNNQQEGQIVDLPEMSYNDQLQFTTLPVEVNSYQYESTRGERERARDTIKGIWVKVMRNGQLIGEYKSSPSTLASVGWDNEEETDIQVTNRFRDSFGTSAKE